MSCSLSRRIPWTGWTQEYRRSFRPYIFFALVRLDRVSSASSSTPWGPISAHVHFARQIISNVVRRGKKNSKNNKREREKVYIVESHTRTETRVARVFPGARISGPRLVYTVHCIYTAGHKYYITIRMTFFSDNLLINGTQIFMHLCEICFLRRQSKYSNIPVSQQNIEYYSILVI